MACGPLLFRSSLAPGQVRPQPVCASMRLGAKRRGQKRRPCPYDSTRGPSINRVRQACERVTLSTATAAVLERGEDGWRMAFVLHGR